MKVLVVSNLWPPIARGGSERVGELTVAGLKELGHDVVVITAIPWSGWQSLWPRITDEQGVRVYRWFPLNVYSYIHAARHRYVTRLLWTLIDVCNPFAYVAARSILRRERPDVIISHNIKGLGYCLPLLFARYTNRYVHVLHDVQLLHPSGLLFPDTIRRTLRTPFAWLYQVITRWHFSTTPVTVAPSRFLLDLYRERGFFQRSRTAVIPNPVLVVGKQKPHDGFNITFIGQLERHKGIETLVAAWQEAALDATLHVVGSGTAQSIVVDAAAQHSRVIVHGRLTGDALNAVWEITDLLVMPSLCIENSPTVIAEALARGIPVVASDVGGVSELVRQSSASKLVPPGDPVALADAFREFSLVRATAQPIPGLQARSYSEQLLNLVA